MSNLPTTKYAEEKANSFCNQFPQLDGLGLYKVVLEYILQAHADGYKEGLLVGKKYAEKRNESVSD